MTLCTQLGATVREPSLQEIKQAQSILHSMPAGRASSHFRRCSPFPLLFHPQSSTQGLTGEGEGLTRVWENAPTPQLLASSSTPTREIPQVEKVNKKNQVNIEIFCSIERTSVPPSPTQDLIIFQHFPTHLTRISNNYSYMFIHRHGQIHTGDGVGLAGGVKARKNSLTWLLLHISYVHF